MKPCKAGHRRCTECGIEKLLGMFKPGAAICTSPCFRMLENTRRACVKDGALGYWEKIKNDPAEKKKAMRWYQLKCPPKEEGNVTRQKAFPVAQYGVIVLVGFGDSLKNPLILRRVPTCMSCSRDSRPATEQPSDWAGHLFASWGIA